MQPTFEHGKETEGTAAELSIALDASGAGMSGMSGAGMSGPSPLAMVLVRS